MISRAFWFCFFGEGSNLSSSWSLKIETMRKSLLFPSYISPNLKLLSVWFEFQTRLAWEKCSSTFWFSDIQFSEITHSILNCQAQTPTDNLKWDSQTQSQPEVMYPSSFIYVPSLSIQGCYLYVFHTAMNWLKQRWSFTLHKYEILHAWWWLAGDMAFFYSPCTPLSFFAFFMGAVFSIW